jgi:hypothetical protein
MIVLCGICDINIIINITQKREKSWGIFQGGATQA